MKKNHPKAVPHHSLVVFDKKLIAIFSAAIALFTLLYMRISFISADENYMVSAAKQSTYTMSLGSTRGQIYDCNLTPLVEETVAYKAVILPSTKNLLPLKHSTSIVLPSDYFMRTKPYVAIASGTSNNIPLVEYFYSPQRYSQTQLAQHVIGYTKENDGVVGIEKQYNDFLTKNSQETFVSYRLNGLGEPLSGYNAEKQIAPPLVEGIVLTIDKRVQRVVEEVGSAMLKKGAIVVLDPFTGKLRAVASFPNYNANHLLEYLQDGDSPLVNRAYSAYNVGSTFKLATAACALTQKVPMSTTFVCNGSVEINGVTFGCHNKNGHGEVNMTQAMEVSCNPYFINLSMMLDKQDLLNMASDLSFGKPTKIGAASGILPKKGDMKNIGDTANLAFGQGALTATPVQQALMISSILNGGNTLTASIVEGTTLDAKTLITEPVTFPTRAMTQQVAQKLKAMMVSAVMDTPAQNAKPRFVTAGGKTATAQTGQFVNGSELLQGWFAGFFPAESPKYVVVVLCEDAQNGNADASPVFAAIADRLR